MPFLRFTRDKRGYETTSLVHSFRGRHGKNRQKVLYWFRTPPDVKVGRPALDPDAIRWIEENNPDLEFDWPKILAATPPPAPATDDQRARRVKRQRQERQERNDRRAAPRGPKPPVLAEPDVRESDGEIEPESREDDEREYLPSPSLAAREADHDGADTDADGEHEDDKPFGAVVGAAEYPGGTPVERLIGREQLIRLRARFAELQARIVERSAPDQVDSLRSQAESLNPDNWVTDEEARKGVAEFEAKIRELRTALGMKPRRRSRRGGRRRHKRPQTSGPTSSGEPSSE